MGAIEAMTNSGRRGRSRGPRWARVAGLACGVSLAAPPVSAQETTFPGDYDAAVAQSGVEGSYGYIRMIEGSARLMQGDTGERVEAAVNEPLLAGDRVFAAGDSRIELLLADGNIVRAGDRAEVLLRALANSGDTSDPGSVIELSRGTLQLVVSAGQRGSEFPSVVTPNATIRARGAGSFLIAADDGRRTEIVVRDGVAEVTTAGEVAEVRRGERLFVEGARGERLEFASAPALDRLEAWGLGLREQASSVQYAAHVEPELHYAASSLRDHGSWVNVDAGVAWRPRVSAGWAPYRHGRWRHTPSGMFWVSHEPWGWVPYHYGYWDLHPSWGWVWFPGSRFAGAHVYWYWGPSYAGWIPTGYYWRHYRNHYGSSWGFHFGVYGHIGGGFGRYRDWTFLPHGRLGHRRQHFYAVSGFELGRGRRALERGVLFTDTRSLGRQAWRRPAETLATLRRAVPRDGRTAVDANGFIDRGTRLPRAIERVAVLGRDGRSAVARRPDASARTGTARGGTVRAGTTRTGVARTSGERPIRATIRPLQGRSPRLERPGVQRASPPAGEARERTTIRRPATRTGDRTTIRQPTTTTRERTTVRSPTVRTGVQRVVRSSSTEVRRPTVRRPTTGTRERATVRRPTVRAPSNPVTRQAGVQRTIRSGAAEVRRPTRPTASNSRWPTMRRATQPTAATGRWPAMRPPTARAGASIPSRAGLRSPSARPQMRPNAARPAPRPAVRGTPSSRRPTARASMPRPSRSGGLARARGRTGR